MAALRAVSVRLRPVEPADKAARKAAGRHVDFVLGLGGDPTTTGPMDDDDVERWFARETEAGTLAIEADGRCVGTLHLRAHGSTARYAIAIWDASAWDRGIGTEATRQALAIAFDERGFHRVTLKVFADHARAVRCYTKAGFVREGLEREVHHGPDGWRDDIVMGILEHEWRAARR
jgi:RimJ/RimL family protein N-acetyltransferase